MQVAALLAQALGPVLAAVVGLQHLAEAVVELQAALAVLGEGGEAELHRFSLVVGGKAGPAPRQPVGVDGLEGRRQRGAPVLVQLAGQQGGLPAEGAEHSLPQHHRPHAGAALDERLMQRQVQLAGGLHQLGGGHGAEVRLGGLGGQGVGQARQQLADVGILKVHPLEGVDDAAVLGEHQIGIAAHQLHGQHILHQVAHLVGAQKAQEHQPVPRLHLHGGEPPAGEVLAQQHAEAGRRLGILEGLLGQADAGGAAAGAEQQLEGVGAGAQGEQHLVPGGLENFVDLRVQQGIFQFAGGQGQQGGIQCHGSHLS